MKAYYAWRARRLAKQATRVLQALDDAMKYGHMNRAERRQVWRSVIAGRTTPLDLVQGGTK